MAEARVVGSLPRESLTGDAAKKYSAVNFEAVEHIRVIAYDKDGTPKPVSRAVITKALGFDPVDRLLEGEYGEFKYANRIISELQVAYDGLVARADQLRADLENANKEKGNLERRHKNLEKRYEQLEEKFGELEKKAAVTDTNRTSNDISDSENNEPVPDAVEEPIADRPARETRTAKTSTAVKERETTVAEPATDPDSSDATVPVEERRTSTVAAEGAPGVVAETETVRTEPVSAEIEEEQREEVTRTSSEPAGMWDRIKGRIYVGQLRWLTRKTPAYRYDDDGVIIRDERGYPVLEESNEARPGVYAVIGFLGGVALTYLLLKNGHHHNLTPGQAEHILNNQDSIMHNQHVLKEQNTHLLNILDPKGANHPGNVIDPNPKVPGNVFTHINDKLLHLLRIERTEHNGVFREFFRGRGFLNGNGLAFHGTHREFLHAPVGGVHDTPWAHGQSWLERELGHDVSDNDPRIRRVTGWILRHSGIRWRGGGWNVDAHQLPVGRTLVVPNINS